MYVHSGINRYIVMGKKLKLRQPSLRQVPSNAQRLPQKCVFMVHTSVKIFLKCYSPLSFCSDSSSFLIFLGVGVIKIALTLPLILTKDQTIFFLTLHTQLPVARAFVLGLVGSFSNSLKCKPFYELILQLMNVFLKDLGSFSFQNAITKEDGASVSPSLLGV